MKCALIDTIPIELRPELLLGDRSVAGGAFVVLATISTRLAHWCRTQTAPVGTCEVVVGQSPAFPCAIPRYPAL